MQDLYSTDPTQGTDHVDHTAPIRQHELDHTDHTDEDYIYPAWQMYVMNCSAVVLHFCTGNR